jgi:SAM-dependent methyltransferase
MSDARRFRQTHFVLGLEGLAILRRWWMDSDAIEARAREIADVVARMDDDDFLSATREVPEKDLQDGYAGWSQTYDEPTNPVVVAEERELRPLLDDLGGLVLDAGCGTGRLSTYLKSRGTQVIGVDQSLSMLSRATSKDGSFPICTAELGRLPFASESFDAAVCALVLTHFADLHGPLFELSRVVHGGGTVLLSDIHPLSVALGGHASYEDAEGGFGVIRNHVHPHSEYLSTFREVGLVLEDCREPTWTAPELDMIRSRGPASRGLPEVGDLASEAIGGLPIVLIWKLRRP